MDEHSGASLIVVVAVEPPPPREMLAGACFAAVARTFGTRAVDDVAIGPRRTAIVILSAPTSEVFAAGSHVALETDVAAILQERGWRVETVEVSTVVSAGSASIREAVEHWVNRLGDETTVTGRSHAFRAAVASLLEDGRIRTLYQPIFDASSGGVVGVEALSRGQVGSMVETADGLLDAARQAGMATEVNLEMIRLATRRAHERLTAPGLLLFVNCDADVFSSELPEPLTVASHDGPWPSRRLVIELTERQPIHEVEAFVQRRDHARRLGVRFALDDAGAGFAGLASVVVLAPEFIKVDESLVRGCDRSPLAQSIVSSLVHLARRARSAVIAEGVETGAELDTVRALGVDMVQGFALAPPAEQPSTDAVRLTPRDRRLLGGTAWRRRRSGVHHDAG